MHRLSKCIVTTLSLTVPDVLDNGHIRFGTRLHFELMVTTKVDTINDNVVISRRTISKQNPCAIYSAPVACIVGQEIEVTPLSKQNPNVLATSDFLLVISSM